MPAEGPLRDGTPAGIELIETLRWAPDGGFVRLERHLARLARSAVALGFAHDEASTRHALAVAVQSAAGLQRVRLTLAASGVISVTKQPFASLPAGAVWRLKIARTRLESSDPLLAHKTSRRAAYDAARAEFSRDEADEVLLLNQRGELCEGTITSLFVDLGDGFLRTPALTCGLLAGVLREELLATGRALEAALMPHDLHQAKSVLIGNSLRGLIQAQLA